MHILQLFQFRLVGYSNIKYTSVSQFTYALFQYNLNLAPFAFHLHSICVIQMRSDVRAVSGGRFRDAFWPTLPGRPGYFSLVCLLHFLFDSFFRLFPRYLRSRDARRPLVTRALDFFYYFFSDHPSFY